MKTLDEQIKEFVNNFINNKNTINHSNGIREYRDFLINTKMIKSGSEISKWLDTIVNNIDIIDLLKKKNGYVNLELFVLSLGIENNNTRVETNRHYSHYHEEDSSPNLKRRYEVTSSSCGSYDYTVDRC